MQQNPGVITYQHAIKVSFTAVLLASVAVLALLIHWTPKAALPFAQADAKSFNGIIKTQEEPRK